MSSGISPRSIPGCRPDADKQLDGRWTDRWQMARLR